MLETKSHSDEKPELSEQQQAVRSTLTLLNNILDIHMTSQSHREVFNNVSKSLNLRGLASFIVVVAQEVGTKASFGGALAMLQANRERLSPEKLSAKLEQIRYHFPEAQAMSSSFPEVMQILRNFNTSGYEKTDVSRFSEVLEALDKAAHSLKDNILAAEVELGIKKVK